MEILAVLSILAIVMVIILPRYATHMIKIKLITTAEESKQFFDLANNYAKSLNREVGVQFTLTDSSVTGMTILDRTASGSIQDKTLRSWTVEDGISATTNPNGVDELVYYPHSAVRLINLDSNFLPTQNLVLKFSNDKNITSDLVIFPNTGASQLFKDF